MKILLNKIKNNKILFIICIVNVLILIYCLSHNNLVENFDINDNDFQYPNLYYINLEKRRVFNTALLHLLWRFYHAIIRYSILYLALITPSILVSKKGLINKAYLEKVKEYFMEDWNKITTIKYKK